LRAASFWGATTVAVTFAITVLSARLVAIIVTGCEAVTFGAEKSPVDEIEPTLADQTTPVLLVFWTCAVNCCVAPEGICEFSGAREMLGTVWLLFAVEELDWGKLLQAVNAPKASIKITVKNRSMNIEVSCASEPEQLRV